MNIRKLTNDKVSLKPIRETPVELPKPEGEPLIYQYGLVSQDRVNVLTLFGIDFHRITIPASCGSVKARSANPTLAQTQTKQYILLSKNQAVFLINEAKKRPLAYYDKEGKLVETNYAALIFFKEEKPEAIEAVQLSVAELYPDEVKTENKKGVKEK